jgi:hypothetical protein
MSKAKLWSSSDRSNKKGSRFFWRRNMTVDRPRDKHKKTPNIIGDKLQSHLVKSSGESLTTFCNVHV